MYLLYLVCVAWQVPTSSSRVLDTVGAGPTSGTQRKLSTTPAGKVPPHEVHRTWLNLARNPTSPFRRLASVAGERSCSDRRQPANLPTCHAQLRRTACTGKQPAVEAVHYRIKPSTRTCQTRYVLCPSVLPLASLPRPFACRPSGSPGSSSHPFRTAQQQCGSEHGEQQSVNSRV